MNSEKEYVVSGIGGNYYTKHCLPGRAVHIHYGALRIFDLSKPPNQLENVVEPEKSYELIKLVDEKFKDVLFVTCQDSRKGIVWGETENAIEIPSTQALQDAISESISEYDVAWRDYSRKNIEMQLPIMERLGLTMEGGIELRKYDRINGTNRYVTEFWNKIEEQIDEFPGLPVIRIKGINEVLEKIPFTHNDN